MHDKVRTDSSYTFKYIAACNMCGFDAEAHKVLGRRLNRSQGKNPRKKIGISTTVVKCISCGLIYSNPLPIPYDLQDHYGVPPDEYWNTEYFKESEGYFSAEIQTLKTLYSFTPGDKALDIGAGIGKSMKALEAAGFDVVGIEPSRQFYEAAISKGGIRPDALTQDSLENANFQFDYFDFITFGAVLEHLYDPSESIRKAMKWLKKGGVMQIEVPSSDWTVSKLLNAFYRIQGLDYVANISPMHEPYHLYEFSLKSFQKHAEQHGYEIIYHQYYVCKTYLPSIMDYLLVPYMRATNSGMQLCVWLRKK